MIGKNHSLHSRVLGQSHFERISLDLGRDRTEKRQSYFSIVTARRNNNRGTSPGLFMTTLRLKIQPNHIAAIGDKPRHLPSFASPLRPGLYFGMEVLSVDLLKQIAKTELASALRRSHDHRTIRRHKIDIRALSQPDLIRQWFRNTHRQTIPPLLHHRFHVSTPKIRALLSGARLCAKTARCG